jgi:hypothetical protein
MERSIRNRVVVASLFALLAGAAAFAKQDGGDFGVSLRQARELLTHGTAYPASNSEVLYPLPAVLIALPFSRLPLAMGGAIFFGVSVGLLAFSITREGWWRLWIFSAFPFLSAVIAVQWPPLLMASVFFPAIGGLAFKPQIGIPCAIRSRSWTAIWSAALIVFASIAVAPDWPIVWLRHTRGYVHYSPLFFGEGLVMLVGLVWLRDADWQFLLTMAAVPQRFFYDAFPLWLIPNTGRELAFMSGCSWISFAYLFRIMPHETFQQVWHCCVLFTYLPAFLILIRREYAKRAHS